MESCGNHDSDVAYRRGNGADRHKYRNLSVRPNDHFQDDERLGWQSNHGNDGHEAWLSADGIGLRSNDHFRDEARLGGQSNHGNDSPRGRAISRWAGAVTIRWGDNARLAREPEAAVKAARRHRRGRAAEEVRGACGPCFGFGAGCLLRRGGLRFGRGDLLAFSCWLDIALRGGSACGFRMPGACSCCGRRRLWLRSLRTRSARLGALSSRLEPDRVPIPPPVPPAVGAAEATCTCAGLDAGEAKPNRLAVVNAGDGSAGGCTCPGIVPAAVRMSVPGPPCALTAARNVGFIPPCPPVVVATVATPRLASCAIWASSRRSLLRTADAISCGTL